METRNSYIKIVFDDDTPDEVVQAFESVVELTTARFHVVATCEVGVEVNEVELVDELDSSRLKWRNRLLSWFSGIRRYWGV
jgi:hypothetical protein